jgi:hypothetical protein
LAASAGIVVAHLLFLVVGCGGAQTHQSVELGAYAADDAVCVTEAQSKDAGAACLDHYKATYAVFWADSGVTVCAVDGGK